jgi:hypothetical protein
MLAQTRSDNLLRTTLFGNATFSVISGAVFALAAAPLAQWMGIPSPWILGVLGVWVLGFGALVWQLARSQPLNLTQARAIFWADALWVVASAVLLLAPGLPFTTEGRWIIALVAEIVLVFAILEFVGLRRAGR